MNLLRTLQRLRASTSPNINLNRALTYIQEARAQFTTPIAQIEDISVMAAVDRDGYNVRYTSDSNEQVQQFIPNEDLLMAMTSNTPMADAMNEINTARANASQGPIEERMADLRQAMERHASSVRINNDNWGSISTGTVTTTNSPYMTIDTNTLQGYQHISVPNAFIHDEAIAPGASTQFDYIFLEAFGQVLKPHENEQMARVKSGEDEYKYKWNEKECLFVFKGKRESGYKVFELHKISNPKKKKDEKVENNEPSK